MASVPTIKEVLSDTMRSRPPAKLPQRIVDAISRQENSSEILVKLIQLTVVGIWGVLYFVSPKTDLGTDFSPVPYALAGYFILNVIGIFWASRRGLPNWAVYFSIVVDIAMLMILIWSFHIQYRQPPSFYLKAPTLLYIFIFIALRALRFQARFVLAAGFAAAAGWLAMTLYAVFSNPSDSMITRNYVEYLTKNTVLIGAEIDKIISIVLVTIIMALALVRARNLLVQAVSEQTAARDLSRFFDRSVAERIRSADSTAKAGDGVRRDAAILFIDVRGFTPMAAKLDAADVMIMLAAYEKRIVPIIQQHHGTIDKFLGDGIMASFGAVTDSKTCVADALRAIDGIMAEVNDWLDDPVLQRIATNGVNAAVAAGPVVFGTLGGEDRLEFTTIGAAVNLAAKLEKHNKSVGCKALTDKHSWDLALMQGYVRRREHRHLKVELEAVGDQVELVVLHD